MIRVIYFCPSEGMYGDNIALMRIMPYLVEKGVIPFFVVGFEGPFVDYLKKNQYDYFVCHNRIWNMYDLSNPLKNFIRCGIHKFKSHFKNVSDVKKCTIILKNFHADIVHSNSSNSSFGFFLAKKLGIKHVWHLREYGIFDSNKQFFPSLGCFIHRLNLPENYSISITPLIHDYFKRSSEDITIYDGVVDENKLPQLDVNKNNYFLYVGRLFYKKGVEEIINAFCAASVNKEKEYELIIAGTGDSQYEEFLKSKVQKLGFENHVHFLGYRNDITNLMLKAKALIVASDFEAFGFITTEAMYAGCYVIGKNTAGTKLQMDNIKKKIGYSIGSRYVYEKDLCNIIRDIMNNKLDVKFDMKRVQEEIVNLYGVEKSANKVFDYYKKILN